MKRNFRFARPRHRLSSLAILLVALLLAACNQQSAGEITISDVWARPAAAGENSAVYFTINNASTISDNLLSASTYVAQAAELHMSMMDENGVMSMQQQERVPIPAGSDIAFEPGGLHVMLVNLSQDLVAGEEFSLTLTFERIGDVELKVPVRAP